MVSNSASIGFVGSRHLLLLRARKPTAPRDSRERTVWVDRFPPLVAIQRGSGLPQTGRTIKDAYGTHRADCRSAKGRL